MEIKSYLSVFKTTAEYEEFKTSADFIVPNITLCDDTKMIHYETTDFFTILNVGTSDLTVTLNQGTSAQSMTYKLSTSDKWSNNKTITIPKEESAKIYKTFNPTKENGIGTFIISGSNFKVQGNVMSLLYGENFRDKTDLTGKDYAFKKLFSGCTTLVDASELTLPATTLAVSGYSYMFADCTKLTSAPELPATTLASDCYSHMFQRCSSLKTPPELPATTLASNCYNGMFYGSALTTAPKLPATTLEYGCYESMFQSCISLTIAPELPAQTLAICCYKNMFNSCRELTKAPILTAKEFKYECYYQMLPYCQKLTEVTMLTYSKDLNAQSYLFDWLKGNTQNATLYINPLLTEKHNAPSSWTVKYYVDINKTPYIIYAFDYNENEQVSFTYNGGVWTPSKDIIDLNSKFSETNVLKFVPDRELVVDLYLQGRRDASVIWSTNQTFKEFILSNRGSLENSTLIRAAIFIKQVKEPIGDSYYY